MKGKPKSGSGMIRRHKDLAKARERGGGAGKKMGSAARRKALGSKGTYWGAVKKGGKK
jgi:hypothetical protein